MFIPVILGTARKGRESEKVANFMLAETKKAGFETELLDVRDYRIEATDKTETFDLAKKYSEKIGRAEGLIVVSPEYNHGYPGELKMMLDMLYREYFYKPLGICGVSSGVLGGARMVEKLRLVSIELHMMPIREAIYFPTVSKLFDSSGNLINRDIYDKLLQAFFKELGMLAKALKSAREGN